MRRIAIGLCLVSACGGPAVSPHAPEPRGARHRGSGAGTDAAPVEPLAALAQDAKASSWVLPGPIQLELGKPAGAPPSAGAPIEVHLFDRAPGMVRAAVRLEHARFAAWIDRRALLPVIARDTRIEPIGPPRADDIRLTLHTGAPVERLGHADKDKRSHIRYHGALEAEGWVADAALSDRAPHDPQSRLWRGGLQVIALPGAVIRTEPQWAGSNNQLALVADARGFTLDQLRAVDHAWREVAYDDGEVSVRGFASTESPPGQVHRWPEPDAAPAKITATTSVAAGTCLYARPDGEPIGYLIDAQQVALEPGPSAAWQALAIDTPWGPVAFAARGASATELEACAPTAP